MYNFTTKTNNKQKQTTYALYMIIASYFHKSVCYQQALETTLCLYYRELSGERQETLEERIILYIEKMLKDFLPAFADLNCEVTIAFKDGEYHLVFHTGFESVTAVVDRGGKYHIAVFSENTEERVVA